MDILIVEDDRALCDTLFDALSARGMHVTQVYSGNAAIEKIHEHAFELLLLDINLPGGYSGFEVLQEARRHYATIAALFMTALDTPKHIEQSFECGGDDYIRKPFSIKELCFRIDAVYKRLYGLKKNRIHIGAYEYDATMGQLYHGDESVMLKPKLIQLLHLLATHPNQTLSREMIEMRLWEGESLPDAAILRIYIKELRDILGHESIQTIRGVGYHLQTL